MKKETIFFIIIFLALSTVLLGGVVFLYREKNKDGAPEDWAAFSAKEALYDAGFLDMKEKIVMAMSGGSAKPDPERGLIQVGLTSHHLPTALPLIADFYNKLAGSAGPRKTFVVVGPDHFERCQSQATVIRAGFVTPFGHIDTDGAMVDELVASGVKEDDGCARGEHSVGVPAVFIKYLYPDAKIVPIILSASAKEMAVRTIAEIVSAHKDDVAVVVSVDFSHYKTTEEAEKLDSVSAKMLQDMNSGGFELKYVDSPASVELGMEVAKKLGARSGQIIRKANSYEFTGQKENTTGYISAFFTEKPRTSTLLFVGDVMLSRSVGKKIAEHNNWSWPFLNIARDLQHVDILFGNLEGPISDKGKNVGSIYSFRADPRTVEGLKYAGFDVLSVANNHIGDWSREAMEDTLKILKENGIEYAGGGFNEKEARAGVIKEINGTKIAYLAYTALGASYTKAGENSSGVSWLDKEKMIQDIASAKERADIVVVSPHFGVEYQTVSNSYQKNIARSAIDAGADIFIGHHPHVAQETERYKDGFIAYSLGNFVFDQYFSKETMSGLMVEIIIEDKKIKDAKTIKTVISPDFQVSVDKN